MKTIASPDDLRERYDIIVVGAGPAGMAAASQGAELGLSVLVADENPAPGGQIYRSVSTTPVTRREILGEDYWTGAALVQRLVDSEADYAPRATVWTASRVDPGAADGPFEVGLSQGGRTRLVEAAHLILATGALERPFPFPGWTLPGVMTAGAAQIALKSSGLVPDGRVVIAGSGPLLYLLAAQLSAAGASFTAMLDTTPRGSWLGAARHAPDFVRSALLGKGFRLLADVRRRVRILGGVTALRAEGDGRVSRVVFERGGRRTTMECDLLLLHQGVIPNINMTSALGCAHDWDEAQRCWRPRLDGWMTTTVAGISVAGDGAGIGGADAAPFRGEIAILGAAAKLGRIGAADRDRRATPVRIALARALRGRAFLDALYRPAPTFLAPPDPETIVCRCEEVTSWQARLTVSELGVAGPNQMKAFLRCGMGPCQGRLCGATVTELIAAERGVSPAEVGYYRLRSPFKPVTVAEIAGLPQNEAAVRAVVR